MEKNQQLIFKNLGYSANGQSPKIKPILHILVLKLTKVGVLVTLLNMTTSMYLSSDMLILTDQYEKTQNAESLNSQCTFNLTSNESTFCTSPDLSIGKNNSAASHYLSPNLSVYGYSPNLNQSNIYEQSLFFMPSPQPSNSSSPLLMDPLSQFVSPICSQPYYQDSPVSFGSFENQPIEPMQSFNFQYDSIDEILHDISPCVDEDIFQLGLGQISQSPTTNLPTANSFKCDIPGCSKV
ncbi:hypothetical protein BC833DRAFT_205269 [Globomyces pollinis-pini]|nr:hypothetical protein BC833DRAFT_205269 [Globomyces pollinis-pini]